MKKKILIHVRPWSNTLSIATAESILKFHPDSEVLFITMFSESHDYIQSQGYNSVFLLNEINSYKSTDEGQVIVKSLDIALYNKYGYGFNMIAAAERSFPRELSLQKNFIESHVVLLDKYIDDSTISISFSIEHFVYWAAAEITNIKGGNNFSFIATGVPQNRILCLKNPYNLWEGKNGEDGIAILKENIEKLELPMSQRLTYMRKVVRPSRWLRISDILNKKKHGRRDRSLNSYFYQDQYNISRIERIILRFLGDYKPSAVDLAKVKYVYFPLHLDPEMTVGIYSSTFANQAEVCKLVAQNLPADWLLLVKENPKMKGKRKRDFYQKVEKLPNTIFVDTSVNSIDLIKNGEATVSLSGTAAYEAALLGKKSLIFGNPSHRKLLKYHSCGKVWNLDDLNDILTSDWDALIEKEQWQKVVNGSLAINLIPSWNDDNKFGVQNLDKVTIKMANFIVDSLNSVNT